MARTKNGSVTTPEAHATSVILVALGVLLSVIFSGILWSWQNQDRQHRSSAVAHERAQAFRKGVESSLEALDNVCTLYRTLGSTDSASFSAFVQPILARHSSMAAIAWVPRIAARTSRPSSTKSAKMSTPTSESTNATLKATRSQPGLVASISRSTTSSRSNGTGPLSVSTLDRTPLAGRL